MRIDDIIKRRKTDKILSNEPWSISTNQEDLNKTIDELLDLANFAPYHKRCNKNYTDNSELDSCVPWRFYVLNTKNCRNLQNYIQKEDIKAGKIGNMLATADSLILVTWLPEIDETYDTENNEILFKGTLKNMEHIAAGSAAIQNLLIGATARDIPNYWSSGGYLRTPELFKQLGISKSEILLAALFLFPKNYEAKGAEIKPGKLRNEGKDKTAWSKRINIDLA